MENLKSSETLPESEKFWNKANDQLSKLKIENDENTNFMNSPFTFDFLLN